MRHKVAFKTLGCRLNQYESDALAQKLEAKGFSVVDFKEIADVYVVNTCSVTAQSDQKSRTAIHHAARREHKPVVVFTGCMADNQNSKMPDSSEITYRVGNKDKNSIAELVEAHFAGEIFPAEYLKADRFAYGLTPQQSRTRTMIKIQDGCDNMCSFCIIPFLRGRAVSAPHAAVLENFRQAVEAGFKELVITGVNIGRYTDGDVDFTSLIEMLLAIVGDFRIRISSIEPETFSDRFIALFENPKLCRHLHLCLQSGSDHILIQMRRNYNTQGYMHAVEQLKNSYPDFTFTTDIMVGFPGETDEDFAQTLHMANSVGFSHIHTFKYSARQGTRSARSTQQVTDADKTARSAAIRAISLQNAKCRIESMIGQRVTILCEQTKNNETTGYTANYIPVRTENKTFERNTFADVTIAGLVLHQDEWWAIGE